MPLSRSLRQPLFDARWVTLRRGCALPAPRIWQRWLTDNGSLTQRLVELSHGHFRVELVQQRWQVPTRSEARLLGQPLRRRALIREVRLLGNEQAWVYARTVVPATTLTGRYRALTLLGNRSLGSLLFSDPTMRRGALQVNRLNPPGCADPVWARRSLFFLSDRPLLVCEVFLPALLQVE